MPTPTQQKALLLQQKHGQFAVVDREVPTPQRGDILIKNESVGLNPVDWKIQEYGLFLENYPAIIGAEGAGVVEAVGEGVTEFQKGDRVLYKALPVVNERAAYQQYTVANSGSAIKVRLHAASVVLS